MSGSYYDLLGVAPSADAAELRRAYLALARRHHPDRIGGDPTAMRSVNDAWATLGDPDRRALYDCTLGVPAGSPPSPAEPTPVRSDAQDLAADLADDTPLGGRVVLPRWLSLVPVAVFAASVVLFGGGLTFGSRPAIAVSMGLFMLSCALFLAAPFVAMLSSRRPPR